MPYQSKAGEWFLTTAWNWIINMLAQLAPALFGCRRVTLKKVETQKQFNNVCEILVKLGAVKTAEGQPESRQRDYHYFKLQQKPIILIVEKLHPVKIIAPEPVIEHVENELKEFLI